MKRIDATYRVQFRGGMTFERAASLVPYLRHLGVSHLYASPIFSAVEGSTHGYDVTDHNRLDPALGGEDGFQRLSDSLADHRLGLILDIVPNHMAASTQNPWWASVVEWGEASPYARHFDIDWQAGPLTLPFLDSGFETCLANHEISIGLQDDGRIAFEYQGNWWPLCPKTWPLVLAAAGDGRWADLSTAAAATGPDSADALHGMVRDLVRQTDFTTHIEAIAHDANLIARLHDAQPWRLLAWREGRRNLTYRRFFEITGLAGLRVEDEAVFTDVHRTVLDLVRQGRVDGLRIDHVDGLADPAGYLTRLRREVGPTVPIYVEKILARGERLPPDWPVQGTTGYEFIAALAGLFTDERNTATLDDSYRAIRGERPDHSAETLAAKIEILTWNLQGELSLLTEKAVRLAATLAPGIADSGQLRGALIALATAFPVYRTYIDDRGPTAPDAERLSAIEAGFTTSGKDGKLSDGLGFLFRLLRLDVPGTLRPEALAFTRRFQQTTSAVMARAVEGTLFYRSSRLIALNEVGGDPQAPADGIAGFHETMRRRAKEAPQGLSATATHDTRRGEDARARLYTLGEAPGNWADSVSLWRTMLKESVKEIGSVPAPDPEMEWMLYQALLGASPVERDTAGWPEALQGRFLAFVEKAMREAKRRTRWTQIDARYEAAVLDYAQRLLYPADGAFLKDFVAKTLPFVVAGLFNSMAETLLKMTAPGIPDIYNGAESWDFSLTDPDNRRPVDFGRLALMLERPTPWPLRREDALDGSIKQHLIASVLKCRAEAPALFAEGSYEPVMAAGPRADRVLAFLRRHDGRAALTVVPRLVLDLIDESHGIALTTWEGTRLVLAKAFDATPFVNGLTGETVIGADLEHVTTAFGTSPVGFFMTA